MNNPHLAAYYICCVIGALTLVALFYALLHFRHSHRATHKPFHPAIGVEITWTLLAVLILMALAAPAIISLKNTQTEPAPPLTAGRIVSISHSG